MERIQIYFRKIAVKIKICYCFQERCMRIQHWCGVEFHWKIRCPQGSPSPSYRNSVVWLLFKASEAFRWWGKAFLSDCLKLNHTCFTCKHIKAEKWKMPRKRLDTFHQEALWHLDIGSRFCFSRCCKQCFLTWKFQQFSPVILSFFVVNPLLNLMTTQGSFANEDLPWEYLHYAFSPLLRWRSAIFVEKLPSPKYDITLKWLHMS